MGLPLLAFAFGTREGRVAFVLFEAPKNAAIQIFGWVLLALLAWRLRDGFSIGAICAAARRPPWRWLGLFLACAAATVGWVAVPANLFYELSQYLLLFLLVLALEVWSDRDPAVPKIVEGALVASLGVATVVGLIQGAFPIAALSPIDPGSGVANPSFLGYKNPMALALVGQIFLLAGGCLRRGVECRSGRLLALLLAAEAVYLATLKSRTSYLALVGATVLLGVLWLAREGISRRVLRAGLAAAAVAVLFVGVLAIDAGSRDRALSALSFARHPARFLESDRGTYLVNSIHMARLRPLGVGFGDWQTQYPVFRQVRRDVYFTPTVQVRSAHGDHAQYLAETGWPGFLLWACFWGSLLALPVREFLRSGEPRAALVAAQAAAYGLAMATDYVAQHPYLKFEFLLVSFLAARVARKPADPNDLLPVGRSRFGAALAVTVLAVAVSTYQVMSLRKAWLGARFTSEYLLADDRGDAARAEPAIRDGDAMVRIPGYHKELSDTYRLLADLKLRLGRREEALADLRRSLRLSPYSPNALALMAKALADRPSEAAAWSRAATYVMNEATDGFNRPYPPAALEWKVISPGRAGPGRAPR